jgi:hypothetical protein
MNISFQIRNASYSVDIISVLLHCTNKIKPAIFDPRISNMTDSNVYPRDQ